MKHLSLDADIRAVYEQRAAGSLVTLSGRITIDSSPELHELLLQHMQDRNCRNLTVDFQDVVYVDTSGLAMLVEILKAARIQGKTFHLRGLRERPRYLLEATGLLDLFDGVEDSQPESSS